MERMVINGLLREAEKRNEVGKERDSSLSKEWKLRLP